MNLSAARALWLLLAIAAATAAALVLPRSAAQPEAPAQRPPSPLDALRTDGGARWPADMVVREGMIRLRAAIAFAVEYPQDDYGWLAQALRREADAMAEQTAIPEEARAQLGIILDELRAAADQLEAPVQRDEGVATAAQALDAYDRFFDHPTWLSRRCDRRYV